MWKVLRMFGVTLGGGHGWANGHDVAIRN